MHGGRFSTQVAPLLNASLCALCPGLDPEGRASREAGYPLRVMAHDVRSFHPGQVRPPAGCERHVRPQRAALRGGPSGGELTLTLAVTLALTLTLILSLAPTLTLTLTLPLTLTLSLTLT